jgi:hypothetical protein
VIAALFVRTGGVYFGLPNVDPWDEQRDARLYHGPWPVVAHPPCQRWSTLAHIHKHKAGKGMGDDGGCFGAALAAVRMWGGVLEHPARSAAWRHFKIRKPGRSGWRPADQYGGWACQVEQGHYGHEARKATWLYAAGVYRPDLVWGPAGSKKSVEFMASDGEREVTPLPFRDLLISIASTAKLNRAAEVA